MDDTELDPTALARRIRAGTAPFLLDVRAESDFEEWRIPGSRNVPVYEDLLERDFSSLATHLDDLPDEREIAVVCGAGVTSARAATFLRERGYDAKSVENGMRGWARVHLDDPVDGAPGVVQVVRPGKGCLSYLVGDGEQTLVVDPSQYAGEYRWLADEYALEIVGVLDTHLHADHVSGGQRLADVLDVPYYRHAADTGDDETDVSPVAEGETLDVGERAVTVRHTPGHTAGSVTLELDEALCTGDTLFLESVGRPDLEDADEDAVRAAAHRLYESLDRLLDYPDDTLVLPGHVGETDLDGERPVAATLADLRASDANDLLAHVVAGEEGRFVDAVLGGLGEEPANFQRIKEINRGAKPGIDVEDLELGPNNCAIE
ncbi:MBL fold metallo-hydrolase [Halarchaeum sp. P4]|uniref:MBL fold metallo-hydrolase n=1 Tax=Halarchaeum sp. P4 TaxID=3421639 RepID=UPI003EB8CAB2